jgi:UDPglucose 6-dehydrogenase
MGYDKRIGHHFLEPGVGYGGSCFPKDVKALTYMAQVNGSHPELLEAVMGINKTQRDKIVLKLQDLLGDIKGKTIALLGLAFKENTDDIRESPALYVAAMLHEQGAIVRGYDPVAAENVERAAPYIQLCNDAYELAGGSDAIVVMTPWNEFKALDMERVYKAMKQPVLVDGRNLYDGQRMKQIGFKYRGVGRGFKGSMEATNGKTDDSHK